jgi:uncharacterized protein (DUF1501 family)
VTQRGKQEKGLVNSLPDLTDLDNNDLKFSVDFRRVYQMVLEKWLQADAKTILGGNFDSLNLI